MAETEEPKSWGLFIEKWYPHAVAIVVVAGYVLFLRDMPIPESSTELLGAVINISAITVGFLATAKSILISIEKDRAIVLLTDSGYYEHLINYLMDATFWSFILAAVSVLILALSQKTLVQLKPPPLGVVIVFCSWLYVLVVTALACYRVIGLFGLILRSRLSKK